MASTQSIDRLTLVAGVPLWRLVAGTLMSGWMCLVPSTADADGTVVGIEHCDVIPVSGVS